MLILVFYSNLPVHGYLFSRVIYLFMSVFYSNLPIDICFFTVVYPLMSFCFLQFLTYYSPSPVSGLVVSCHGCPGAGVMSPSLGLGGTGSS